MDYRFDIDVSYNEFFTKMLKWMVKGVGVTFLTTIIMNVSQIASILAFAYYPVMIFCTVVEIAMVFILVKKIDDINFESALRYFYIYSVLNGLTISFVLASVGPKLSILAFMITFVYFGLLYTIAKHSNSEFIGLGKICMSALLILMVMYIVLMFINVPVLYYIVVFVDLAVFTGLTLYDLKKVRRIYDSMTYEQTEAMALLCALELYLDFINIFLDIVMLIADNN